MRIARVVGQVISTVKPDSIAGRTILLLRDIDATDASDGEDNAYAALDLIGAGSGEVVIVAHGGAARTDEATVGTPIDAAAIGIVDSLVVEGKVTYEK